MLFTNLMMDKFPLTSGCILTKGGRYMLNDHLSSCTCMSCYICKWVSTPITLHASSFQSIKDSHHFRVDVWTTLSLIPCCPIGRLSIQWVVPMYWSGPRIILACHMYINTDSLDYISNKDIHHFNNLSKLFSYRTHKNYNIGIHFLKYGLNANNQVVCRVQTSSSTCRDTSSEKKMSMVLMCLAHGNVIMHPWYSNWYYKALQVYTSILAWSEQKSQHHRCQE